MNGWTWGILLDGMLLTGTWLLGSKRKVGWLVSLFSQVLWSVYAITTKQYGWFPGIALYSLSAFRGYRKWTREGPPT